jgi:hypothetical protein
MMSIEAIPGNALVMPQVFGKPNSNQHWIHGKGGVAPWRITERSVTEAHNRIHIVQADGTRWLAVVKGPVRSGKVAKGYVDLMQLDRFEVQDADTDTQKYEYDETVTPLGVKTDFLIGVGVLSLAELETLTRPMQWLAENGGQGVNDPIPEASEGKCITDEQSAQIALNEQRIEGLKNKLVDLQNEISRSQELLSELDSNIGVKLLADSDKYSLASYPDIPHIPLYEVNDVRKHFKGKAGIYFAISRKHGGIEYVGRSEDLGTRVSAGRDELRGCIFSILQMPEWETHAAELAYIAACRPARNAHIQRAKNGRVNSGTPKEYLTVSQARDYVARTTWGAKTLHDATIDGLKIKAISDGRELVSVADLKRIVESEWCFEEIEAVHRAAEQGKKLKRGIKF